MALWLYGVYVSRPTIFYWHKILLPFNFRTLWINLLCWIKQKTDVIYMIIYDCSYFVLHFSCYVIIADFVSTATNHFSEMLFLLVEFLKMNISNSVLHISCSRGVLKTSTLAQTQTCNRESKYNLRVALQYFVLTCYTVQQRHFWSVTWYVLSNLKRMGCWITKQPPFSTFSFSPHVPEYPTWALCMIGLGHLTCENNKYSFEV